MYRSQTEKKTPEASVYKEKLMKTPSQKKKRKKENTQSYGLTYTTIPTAFYSKETQALGV